MRGRVALALAGLAGAIIFSSAVAKEQTVVAEKEHPVKVTCQLQGPKVVVGSITCKAAECQGGGPQAGGLMKLLQLAGVPSFEGLGEGLKDMFTAALNQTGCFKVVDPKALKELEELGIQTAKVQPDYVVTGAITSIAWEQKSGSFGGGLIPIVGAITTTKSKARMAMDVRVVRVSDGEVVLTKTYSAESGKTRWGVLGAGAFGFGGAASGLSGTAMEEVARDIIARASTDIAKALVPEAVEVKPAATEALGSKPEEPEEPEKTESSGPSPYGY